VPVDYKKRPRRRKSRKIGGKMTLAEYFATPETLKPQELVFGAHRVADSPTPRHQRAVLRLAMTLNEHVRRHLLGEVWLAPLDVVLDAERALIVQPDLMVVTTDQFEIVTDRIWGAPALVIEVLSPRPRVGEIDERLGWFATYGVRECWLIHQQERAIEILTFHDGAVYSRRRFEPAEVVQSTVLPDFSEAPTEILGY
jgi:Uma2 family endonuclease